MSLLRFTAALVGLASAFLYVIALFAWQGSWLSLHYPWARSAPLYATFALGGAVSIISAWRLTTRTLPPGGGDLFGPKESDFRFSGDWDLAFYAGLVIAIVGAFTNQFVTHAGVCLVVAGGAQKFRRGYEDHPDA